MIVNVYGCCKVCRIFLHKDHFNLRNLIFVLSFVCSEIVCGTFIGYIWREKKLGFADESNLDLCALRAEQSTAVVWLGSFFARFRHRYFLIWRLSSSRFVIV